MVLVHVPSVLLQDLLLMTLRKGFRWESLAEPPTQQPDSSEARALRSRLKFPSFPTVDSDLSGELSCGIVWYQVLCIHVLCAARLGSAMRQAQAPPAGHAAIRSILPSCHCGS